MKNKPKAIVWDLDGTLLDTLTDLFIGVNHALSAEGLPDRTKEEIRSFVGNGIAKLITRAVPAGTDDETVSRVLEAFTPYYKAHMNDHTAPYPGILSLLARLKTAGVPMAVVSNKADYATKALVAAHFGDTVTVAVGERPGVPEKPAPDGVFEALRLLSLSPREAVYIGDSQVDVQTAMAAGMPGIAVSWGFRDKAALLAAGATHVADTPEALGRLLGI